MVALCESADVFSVVSSASVPSSGRLCAFALNAGDVFELDCHGYALDDALRFRAEEGGSLPTGITAGTTYYAIPVDESRFQVSATSGGAAVTLTADGDLVVVMRDRPVVEAIAKASAYVGTLVRGKV